MKPTVEQLQAQIDELKAAIESFKNYSTIPLDIGEAFKARILGQSGLLVGKLAAGTPGTVGVFIPPSTNYTVAAPFNKQLQVVIDGVTYIIPAN